MTREETKVFVAPMVLRDTVTDPPGHGVSITNNGNTLFEHQTNNDNTLFYQQRQLISARKLLQEFKKTLTS